MLAVIAALFVFRPNKNPAEAPVVREREAQPAGPTITIGDATVSVLVADTEALRAQGLSGKASLAESEGMLFIFPHPGRYGFWMKDMLFPIDIIWIHANGEVADMTKGVTPDTYPQAFFPKTDIQYVLEVQSGFSDRHEVSIGEKIFLENFLKK